MKTIINNLLGTKKGLLSVISNKEGKISLKRSFPILLLTAIVVPLIATEGLTWPVVGVIGIAAGTYVLPKVFGK